MLIEHSLHIQRRINEGEHLFLRGFQNIIQIDESFVEGDLVFVEVVVDVGDSDELGDGQVGLLPVVVAVGKHDGRFEHDFLVGGVNAAGARGGDGQCAV